MDQVTINRVNLKNAIESDGGSVLMAHLDEEIKSGWDKFIDLPAERKTGKTAFEYQARYKVLKDLREWIGHEVSLAEKQ